MICHIQNSLRGKAARNFSRGTKYILNRTESIEITGFRKKSISEAISNCLI